MKILLISRGFPSQKDPQWGNFEYEQAQALKAYGHDVVMMSISRKNGFRFSFEKVQTNGIVSYNLNVPVLFRTSLYLPIPLLQGLAMWLFRKILADGHMIDLIYSHYLNNSILALSIRRRFSIPLVVIEHWSKIIDGPLPFHINFMGQVVYNKADMIIAVSESLKNRIKKHFLKEAIVINNMVSDDFDLFEKISLRTNSIINFVSVGSLINRKGYDILIEAFASVYSANKNVRLSIIGEGEERNNLEDLISRYSLDNIVRLLGKKTKEEIVDIYKSSDAFVLSSRSETFGVVYIEAMMMGLPIIGTKCGGPEEFINESNGILVNVDDVEGVSNAMLYMANNISKYNREYINTECKKRFSSRVIAEQLTKCFESVLSKY